MITLDPNGALSTLVTGATGTGVTVSTTFKIDTSTGMSDRALRLQYIPTGAFTAFTVNLEYSPDGTSWSTAISAINLHAGAVSNIALSTSAFYRIRIATFTGGSAASIMGSYAVGIPCLPDANYVPDVIRAYVDTAVTGLLDFRGVYNASVNTFPTTGGSGVGGAVSKGDLWIISVAGTLGGTVVNIGDQIIAKEDVPAQTASKWAILQIGLVYQVTGVASPSAGQITKWGASGNTIVDTGATFVKETVGFTLAGGTTSKTLTVPLDATVSGSNTGDQNLSGYAPLASPTFTGTVNLPTGGTGAVPLLMTSGTLKSAAVAGGLEFNNDSLYFTITSGNSRKTIAFTDSNSTGTAAGLTAQYIDWTASSGGDSIKNRPNMPFVTKYTVAHTNAAFTVSATTANVILGALLGNAKVMGVTIKHSVPFVGAGMTTTTVSLGDGSTPTAYSTPAFDIAQATADTAFQDTGQYKSTTMAASNLVAHFIADVNFGATAGTVITAAANGDPIQLTCITHGLKTGATVTISGATGSWAPINGPYTITRDSANLFSIAGNSTTWGALTGSPVFSGVALSAGTVDIYVTTIQLQSSS